MKYKDESGQWKDLVLPATGDTLPIGTVVDFDGDVVPSNWERVNDSLIFGNETISLSVQGTNTHVENGRINFSTIDFNTKSEVFEKIEIFPYGIKVKKDCYVLVGGCLTFDKSIYKMNIQVNELWTNRELKLGYATTKEASVIIPPTILKCSAGERINVLIESGHDEQVYVSPYSSWLFASVIKYI